MAAVALALSISGAAQSSPLANRDVVTLASAGFSESFILETIMGSRTQFDTSTPALADLMSHAVSERIIRAMMDPSSATVVNVSAASESVPVVMPGPGPAAAPRREKAPKASAAVAVALQSGTPYYEWKSVFWGLWTKRAGVAAPPAAPMPVAQHLGPVYQYARPPQPYPVREYPYEPMTYYAVAPR